jgi:hypothetical protein
LIFINYNEDVEDINIDFSRSKNVVTINLSSNVDSFFGQTELEQVKRLLLSRDQNNRVPDHQLNQSLLWIFENLNAMD